MKKIVTMVAAVLCLSAGLVIAQEGAKKENGPAFRPVVPPDFVKVLEDDDVTIWCRKNGAKSCEAGAIKNKYAGKFKPGMRFRTNDFIMSFKPGQKNISTQRPNEDYNELGGLAVRSKKGSGGNTDFKQTVTVEETVSAITGSDSELGVKLKALRSSDPKLLQSILLATSARKAVLKFHGAPGREEIKTVAEKIRLEMESRDLAKRYPSVDAAGKVEIRKKIEDNYARQYEVDTLEQKSRLGKMEEQVSEIKRLILEREATKKDTVQYLTAKLVGEGAY